MSRIFNTSTKMKRTFTLFIATILVCITGYTYGQKRAATNGYRTAVGLRLDLGDGGTGVGPNVKHFFNANSAIDGALLFYDGGISLEADYEYNQPIAGAAGLNWYVGVGPELLFPEHGDTGFAIRPNVGLEFTPPTVPLNFGFDWRPRFLLTPDSDTNAGRFGLSIRYAF